VLACLALTATALRADQPIRKPASSAPVPSPLTFIPDQADLLIQVKQPRRLVEAFTALDAYKQLQSFAAVREFFASTTYRRFTQLVAYFEKELGGQWPELLDRLGGGGLAIGVKLTPGPGPALLVLQGTDEKLVQQAIRLGLDVLEQELGRQENKDRPVKGSYQGIETIRIGKDFHLAVAGSTVFIANVELALHMGLDLHRGAKKSSILGVPAAAEADKLLPKESLATVWLNMETVRQAPQLKDAYKFPRENPAETVLFGNYFDLLGRTPSVCAGLVKEGRDLVLSIRMPVGREGMGVVQTLHLPAADQPGVRPLLEPKGVLYSDSFYLDVARIWEDRDKLLVADQARGLERFDKDTGKLPIRGLQISKLLTNAGPYFRVVVANQPKVGYKTTPKTPIPTFAILNEMRDPEAFTRTVSPVLRSLALFATFQVKLKLVEEKYKDCDIVGYRFDEETPFKPDVNDIRFNFSPCFVRVGSQFLACSTLELCHELIDLLKAESQESKGPRGMISSTRFYASGLANVFENTQDQLITQAILDQAVPAEKAREEVKAFIGLLRSYGASGYDVIIDKDQFQFNLRISTGK
jgi:hypothetical protein